MFSQYFSGSKKPTIKAFSLLLFSISFFVINPEWAFAFDHSHSRFTGELQKYVSLDSVDYEAWKEHPEELKRYLDSLSSIEESEYKTFSKNEKKAIWLNAYNALTIYLVLQNYPIKGEKNYYPADSIRQLDGFWEEHKITIGGKTATLAQIEHNVLRRDLHDPRTHFAVVPAARGGATIDRVAFKPTGLDIALGRKTREYLGSSNNVRIDASTGIVYVTQLFRWFPIDFAKSVGLERKFPPPTDDEIIVAYLKKYGPNCLGEKLKSIKKENLKVVYEPFDWSLNDLCTVK